jgi:hypothetical protein
MLALVLATAIPLQGFAAASMLLCGPGHGRMTVTLAAAGAADADPHAMHHGHHGASAGTDATSAGTEATAIGAHHNHAAAADVADDSSDGPTSPLHDKPAFGKCSLCASCCAGTVIVNTPLALPFEPGTAAHTAIPSIIRAGVVPSGLERPPRT